MIRNLLSKKENQAEKEDSEVNSDSSLDDPHWSLIIDEMYRSPQPVVGQVSGDSWHEYMSEKTGLGEIRVRGACIRLEGVGLIEKKSEVFQPPYTLTPEGFRIAHERLINEKEREMEDRNTQKITKINSSYTQLTFLLVVVGIIEILPNIFPNSGSLLISTVLVLVAVASYLVFVRVPSP